MRNNFRSSPPRLLSFFLCTLLAFSAACNRGSSSANSSAVTKHYSLKGKVVSIDKLAAAANVDNEPIAGYMDQMTMAYPVKPPAMFDQLQPGDSITADLVVEPDNKYWLENVKVIAHSNATGKPAAAPQKEKDKESK
jgi:Cu/Ag efflux protein CusF